MSTQEQNSNNVDRAEIIDYTDPLNPKPAKEIHPFFPTVIDLNTKTPNNTDIITHGDHSSY